MRSNDETTEFQLLGTMSKNLLMRSKQFQSREKFNTNSFMSYSNTSSFYLSINMQRLRSWSQKSNQKPTMLIESSNFWLKTQRRMKEEIKWQRDSQWLMSINLSRNVLNSEVWKFSWFKKRKLYRITNRLCDILNCSLKRTTSSQKQFMELQVYHLMLK